jgi:hypothetical protein
VHRAALYRWEELAAAGVTVHLPEPADTAFARGRKRSAKIDKAGRRAVINALRTVVGNPHYSRAGGLTACSCITPLRVNARICRV